MTKRIITNPKFIVERDGDNWVLKFRAGNIYKPIEFNNAQSSGKRNAVISQPNFSIIDDKLFVNVNGHDVKIGEVGDGYTLAGKLTHNSIVEPNLDVVITSNGGVSVVTEIGGKNITINGGDKPEPVYTNRLYYTVVEGGTQPTSTWITENCSDNVFDAETGEGYLVLNEGVTELNGSYDEEHNISHTIFKDMDWNDEEVDENIATVVIPTQITSIGYEAFYFCYELASVTIPNSVTSIGDSAFGDCASLASVTIPNSVTSIGAGAFSHCSSLASVTIPNSITSIGEDAFSSCESLASVTIPNSVTSIGAGVFFETGLTSITIPNSVTSISNNAFRFCASLASVTIPNSVTSIGDSAFGGCTSLASVTIPNSVTSIGAGAFSDSGLTSITIPNSVTSIGAGAFSRCSSLASVTIPNGVTSIGDNTFVECASLASVTIPNSITSIGELAFAGANSLASVECMATTPPNLGIKAFEDIATTTCGVLEASLQAYKDDASWSAAFTTFVAADV